MMRSNRRPDRRRERGWVAAAALAIGLVPAAARAQASGQASGPTEGKELAPQRLEPAVLPVLGGDTDIGFLFGAYGALARFEPGYDPFRWKLEVIASLTVKDGPTGAEFPVHNDGVSLDLPGLAGGRVRLLSEIAFARDIDARYFGLGNASSAARAPGDDRRRYQYVRSEPLARLTSRIRLDSSFELLLGMRGRYEVIDPYPGSKLLDDPQARGTADHAAVQLLLGVLLDTRDDESAPSRGMYHELSLRASGGEGVSFAGATFHARFFAPLLGSRLVLATRVVADALFGDPPFYELARAGGFVVMDLPGGNAGIRGVPAGRYHGPFKLAASAELRATLLSFQVAGQHFRIGAAGFADAGRVWSTPELDGDGLGLKYGLGGGARIHWGETVVIRADVAYSPDAAIAAGDSPVGVYVEIGQSF
jgi:hypothetical protein